METTKGEITRNRVLRTALNLINIKGFNNTSISDIIDATGVKKGNLYFHFSSKEDLGRALIHQAKEDYLKYLAHSMRGQSPLEKVDSIMNAIYTLHRDRKFIGGCIFGNTALEMSDSNEQFASLIRDVFRQWIGMLANLLQQAVDEGELESSLTPLQLARHIVAALEGSIMMARLSKDESDLYQCIEVIRILLGIHTEG